MPTLTVAFCTFKRADRLENLVAALRAQSCPVAFEILAVNNNSPDNTLEVLADLQRQPGASLRVVTEMAPGIVPARNRALTETLDRDILVFIDDDESPFPGLLQAVTHAILEEDADCVGGPIKIDFEPYGRPGWLDKELSGFLGEIDYGPSAFWIQDDSAPVWSGNVAYRMEIFRKHPDLRFDLRYNREGVGLGGGEDAMMFRALLDANYKIRYRPDMEIAHFVDAWKLKRRYFLKLHYRAGLHHGQFRMPAFPRMVLGVPPFLIGQFLTHCLRSLSLILTCKPGQVRQHMNAAHSLGCILGYRKRIAQQGDQGMFISHYKNRIAHALRKAWWAIKLAHFPATTDGRRLLHVGCGDINSPDFINLDARPMPHVHIVSKNIFQLRMIPDACLDMVYMSHVLEHVPRGQVLQTIKEMARVLKPDGVLRISVPDFDHIVHLYQASGNDINSIAPALMGGQNYNFNFHYAVFNKTYLADLLEKGGFHKIIVWDPDRCEHHDFEDWASKNIDLSGRPFPISLNLEAHKS